MDEKLKALANEMMEAFQKQGLTCREVDCVLMLIRTQSADQKNRAADRELFTAKLY